MTRICFIKDYCFEKTLSTLLIYKNNILIYKYTRQNIPKNIKKIFNNFSMENIELYLHNIK